MYIYMYVYAYIYVYVNMIHIYILFSSKALQQKIASSEATTRDAEDENSSHPEPLSSLDESPLRLIHQLNSCALRRRYSTLNPQPSTLNSKP